MTSFALSQNGGFDGNPQNPANWDIKDPIFNGLTKLEGKKYVVDSSGMVVVVPTTWERNWGSGTWKRDGVPVGISPLRPWGDAVMQEHQLKASSQGTITLQLEWISPVAPAPPRVTVMLRTSAESDYTNPVPFGWGTVDNGISNSSAILRDANGYLTLQSYSLTERQLLVTAGVAEITLTKSATAESPTGWAHGRVYADAESSWLSVKTMRVQVNLNNSQTRLQELSETLAHTIVPEDNPHHDVFVAAAYRSVSVSWLTTRRRFVEPTVSGTNNHAQYKVACSTRPDGYQYGWSTPDRFTWTGHSHPHNADHCEHYDWNPGPSGTFENAYSSDYVIPEQIWDATPNWVHKVEGADFWGLNRFKSAEIIYPDNAPWDMELFYDWVHATGSSNCSQPGGTETATRHAEFVKPVIEVATSGSVSTPSHSLVPVWIESVQGYRVASGLQRNHQTGLLEGPAFWTRSQIDMAGKIVDLTGEVNIPAVKVFTLGLAALGIVAEYQREKKDPIAVDKYGVPETRCWWYENGAMYLVPPPGWDTLQEEYDWEAYIRPNNDLCATVVDRYDQNGYVNRILVEQSFARDMGQGREFRKYYHQSPSGGGGGGTGGSGSGGS